MLKYSEEKHLSHLPPCAHSAHSAQRRNQNPEKRLRWSLLPKQVTVFSR